MRMRVISRALIMYYRFYSRRVTGSHMNEEITIIHGMCNSLGASEFEHHFEATGLEKAIGSI